ncbi:MAG TPA: hypothetical protein VLL05_06645 [Terriglobales bacterium]|nr:hypothetical protein [Terriglobales bacterium]
MKSAMKSIVRLLLICLALQCGLTVAAAAGSEAVLKASDITTKIFPDQVFFRGRVASVQMRNTGGVRFADDMFVLAALVDNSGYSSDIRQKYQAYFISEVALEIGGQKLAPGAYGVGFVQGKFVVMDLGAHDLFQADSAHDAEIKRPVPLQLVNSNGKYRLYSGRDYVEFARAQ